MKNIGARPVLAPSVIDTSISCSISSKLMGPCRLWPGRRRPRVTGIEPLLDELPSEGSGAELKKKFYRNHRCISRLEFTRHCAKFSPACTC